MEKRVRVVHSFGSHKLLECLSLNTRAPTHSHTHSLKKNNHRLSVLFWVFQKEPPNQSPLWLAEGYVLYINLVFLYILFPLPFFLSFLQPFLLASYIFHLFSHPLFLFFTSHSIVTSINQSVHTFP